MSVATGQEVEKEEIRRPVSMPELNTRTLRVRIRCLSPLMQNKPTEKMSPDTPGEEQAEMRKWYLEDPQDGYKYGHPAAGFRQAIIAAARNIGGESMTQSAQAISIVPQDPGGCVALDCSEPVVDERFVNVGGKQGQCMWYRPRYDEWSCVLEIDYDADVFSAEDILKFVAIAGQWIGIGSYRPQKVQGFGGPFGRFEIVPDVEIEEIS